MQKNSARSNSVALDPLAPRFRSRSWRPTHFPTVTSDLHITDVKKSFGPANTVRPVSPPVSDIQEREQSSLTLWWPAEDISIPRYQAHAAIMSHESVWYSRPRGYGKGARSWYDFVHFLPRSLPILSSSMSSRAPRDCVFKRLNAGFLREKQMLMAGS